MLLAFFVCACAREEVPDAADGSTGEPVAMDFALAVSGSGASTRTSIADISEIQDSPVFRGMRNIWLLPFESHSAVKLYDRAAAYSMSLDAISTDADDKAVDGVDWHSGLVRGSSSHLYKDISLPKGSGSVLVYGQAVHKGSAAEGTAEAKRLNGSIIAKGITASEKVRYPSGITFSPEAIYTAAAETEYNSRMSALLSYLNGIAGASVRPYTSGNHYFGTSGSRTNNPTFYWATTTAYNNNAQLINAFSAFTNSGNKMSGSSTSINALLTTLYRAAYALRNSTVTATYYNRNSGGTSYTYQYVAALAQAIYGAINNSSYVTVANSTNATTATVTLKAPYNELPSTYGLPDGSAAIKWNGSNFVVVDNSDTINGMAERSAYCYPASLWYFANSTVKTSMDESVKEEYTQSNSTWNDILAYYPGNTVTADTKSAAVKDPLRYGPALLEATIVANSASLTDSNSSSVSATGSNLPLKGIIIGKQRVQQYNFTPSTAEAYLNTEYSLYDTNVKDAAGATINLTSSKSSTFKVLVFPTEEEADIPFMLEFTNATGSDFHGMDGQLIPAGGTFYLSGTIKISPLSDAERTVDGERINSVFTHSHKTAVSFKVKDLASAQNTIPDLRNPQLAIAIGAELSWIQATSSNLEMY